MAMVNVKNETQREVFISKGNSKMGNVPNVSLTPGESCRADAPCAETNDCYAMKGRYKMYPKITQPYAENLAFYQEDPEGFFNSIIRQLTGNTMYRFFRWHAAGDIVDKTYFEGMIKVATEVPETKFLCFTKQYEIINEYLAEGSLPKNLKMVFSGWGADWHFDNPYNLPEADVKFKEDDRDFSNHMFCSGRCDDCFVCWKLDDEDKVVFDVH